jgi:hypothetical protein
LLISFQIKDALTWVIVILTMTGMMLINRFTGGWVDHLEDLQVGQG